LANQTRQQDRELNQKQLDQEDDLADAQRQETILADYLRQISELILSNDIEEDDDDDDFTLFNVMRSLTLVTFRQLNSKRKTFIIQFLYDMNLLNVLYKPIDLIGANLDGDLSTKKEEKILSSSMIGLRLPSTSLVNATFDNRRLEHSDFHNTQLTGASFKG
jgi:uncharacterized protein YjbI with pentapeptide repeats